ncbi:hypothetical protein BC939DRAFT_527666 [Gamsiella multidivaricata]|uniref:uncharacterized protein n=1 Tax=Gamsiella multidivaricata TaxID=101098 RepID=UPI00221F84A3|nr:uncharacterized protein BC939DRAFT_527666 [Gamsiella multidivaricata]KAG0370933.1 hypothetical protein BGZ54_002432 [Gamsiella multidivaricata]KAI7826622.1 hypothetical protein BC939DRAFT_527666 [Gamsiella multidivaricata]
MSSSLFREEYALNPHERSRLVKATTPGTEDHYLYRLQYLLQQLQTNEIPVTAQTIEEAAALLTAAENSGIAIDSAQLQQFETQIALLAFPVKPDLLLGQLNYDPGTASIDCSQEDVESEDNADTADDKGSSSAVAALPTKLDQSIIRDDALTEKQLDHLEKDSGHYISIGDAWPFVAAQPRLEPILDRLDIDRLLHLFATMDIRYSPKSMEIVGKADVSRFDQIVVKVILRLYKENKLSFSSYAHQFEHLTRSQLDMIKREQPQLVNDEGFIGLLEKRLAPEPFPEQEEVAHEAWLDRVLAFVDELSPKFNLHKLSVYLMSLEHDLSKGVMDKEKFLRYVAIPRNQAHYNQKALNNLERSFPVDLTERQRLEDWSERVTPATRERDDEVLKEYLTHFMRQAKSAAEFEEYFETKTFLNPLLAKAMLMSDDPATAKWAALLSDQENLAQLTEKTILKFAPDNPVKFLPADPVVFKLRAKNAKRVLVRIFEVKTFEYLQQHGHGVMGRNLNLDGLAPNWEQNLVLDHPPLLMHEIKIELPELADKRGAFIMDVISNGENSCAYFAKGYLDFIERQSVAGHVITIIDENQEKLSDKCSIWLDGYYYRPNGDGDIIVPYRKPYSSSSSNIYLIHDGFATCREFNHRVEDYALKFECQIDHESLVAGSTAKILIKPTVKIQYDTVVCPVSLLEQVQLTLDSADTNTIAATVTVPDFKVHDDNWSMYSFQVPENLAHLTVTLSAKIKVISTGEYQNLTVSRRFAFDSPNVDQNVGFKKNGVMQYVSIPGPVLILLQKDVDGYKVLALGKNGEKRPNIPLEFEFNHPIWGSRVVFHLRTDDSGQAHLGPLHGVENLICVTTLATWPIFGGEEHVYPKQIHGVEDETLSLPLGKQDLDTIRKISLFSISSYGNGNGGVKATLDDHTSNIRLVNGMLSLKGLKAGYYSFRIGSKVECQIIIANSRATQSKIQGLEDFVIGCNPMLELLGSTKNPLHIAPPTVDAESQMIGIQLYNWSPETRLCVIVTKFVPYNDSGSDNSRERRAENPWAMTKSRSTLTSFRTGRVLGDEYQYILNRKAQSAHWAGNLLEKPSVLLSPWSIADTTASTQEMQGDSLEGVQETIVQECACMPTNMSRGGERYIAVTRMTLNPLLNFLAHPSVVLANLVPDSSTGIVSVPFPALKEGNFLRIFAVDGHQTIQKSFVVPRTLARLDFQKRDLRFWSQLDHTKHFIGERTGIDLDPKLQAAFAGAASVTLASNGSSLSAVRVISSVKQVYDLMLTLLGDETPKENLRKFGFINDWDQMSDEAKKEKFSRWNCHELNLFLYKKDGKFFDSVVAPFLKNRLMKSFMDDYLIGAQMDKYTALNEFSQLSCLEKCLLAHRAPSARAGIVQWIKDRVRNTRVASNVKLFLTVMNSGGLKESALGGSVAMRNQASEHYYDLAVDHEESDEDMGFGLFDDDTYAMPEAASAQSYSAPALTSVPIKRMKKSAAAVSEERKRSARILHGQYKPVELTQEMAETYYYGRQEYVDKIENTNLFWLDLAQWDENKGGSFLSQNFVANTGSFTDAMATIALLGLTFRPKDASLTRSAGQNLVVSSESPAIVFHSSIKELTEAPVMGSVLVIEQYFAQKEKLVYDKTTSNNVRQYLQPGVEFRPLETYGAHVVLMNASPNYMVVHLEVQIPQGSISVYQSLETGQDIRLSPHSSFQYEYGFYFPEEGDFPHYPAHVSNYEDIIAHAAPSVLKVRAPLPGFNETETGTWAHILKYGTKESILAKLAASPLSSLPVEDLVPRLYRDKQLLQQMTSALRSRHEYNNQIWRVALAVKDQELVKEYLMNQPASELNTGDWFTSAIYIRRPHTRLESLQDTSYKHLEYFPLINARAHKATRNATILNNKFKGQYDRFLKLLSQKPHHDVDDLLVLVVYLLAQDRFLEAKKKFAQLSDLMCLPGQLPGDFFQQLQYDYLWAYLSLCVEVQADSSAVDLPLDLAGVQRVLNKYRDYPVERWNKMFRDMQQYLDDIEQSQVEVKGSSDESQAAAAAEGQQEAVDTTAGEEEEDDDASEVPIMIDFKIGDENVMMVRHRGVREVTVEYYLIDAETMFSASPLTFSDLGESESSGGSRDDDRDTSNSYRLMKPNGIDTHSVKRAVANDGILIIPILSQYQNTNVMISVSTSPPAVTRSWKAYYSQTIMMQCMEKNGTMKVISKADGRPIRGAYVKVYAEMKEGSGVTIFWKDGYTDLVGRFGYAQVSTATVSSSSRGASDGGLGSVKRFAVFVDGGREGCVVKTLPVPPV